MQAFRRNFVKSQKAIVRRATPTTQYVTRNFHIKQTNNSWRVNKQTKRDIEMKGTQILRQYATEAPEGVEIVELPAVSPTMKEGVIVEWMVEEGDFVEPGDVICSIKSDKAVVDFEYQEEGYVAKILQPASENPIPVRQPIALIVEEEEDIEKAKNFTPDMETEEETKEEETKETQQEETKQQQEQQQQEEQQAEQKREETTTTTDRIKASPLARTMANEKGYDIGAIQGTGPGGRVIAADVEEYKPEERQAQQQQRTTGIIAEPTTEYEEIPVSMMREVIATRLLESKNTVPHYYLTIEVEMDALMAVRSQLNTRPNANYKLSVNDFIIKAASAAMKEVPEVNSSWHGDTIRQYKNVDVSVAVQTETGLITPIVPKAETKGLVDISNKVKELAGKARENKLQPHEYQGGTFTVSNLGMFGIKEFSAIINPPQACILAVGTANQKVTQTKEGEYKTVAVMNATLSCDHRVVDGAVGARWLAAFKANMEDPLRLML